MSAELSGWTVLLIAVAGGLGGAAAGAGEPSDGVVDHAIPSSGVPDGSYFLMVVWGPVRMFTDGAASLAVHDVVKTAASGKVTKDTGTPTTNGKCAKVMDASVTNVDGTEFWGFFVGPESTGGFRL